MARCVKGQLNAWPPNSRPPPAPSLAAAVVHLRRQGAVARRGPRRPDCWQLSGQAEIRSAAQDREGPGGGQAQGPACSPANRRRRAHARTWDPAARAAPAAARAKAPAPRGAIQSTPPSLTAPPIGTNQSLLEAKQSALAHSNACAPMQAPATLEDCAGLQARQAGGAPTSYPPASAREQPPPIPPDPGSSTPDCSHNACQRTPCSRAPQNPCPCEPAPSAMPRWCMRCLHCAGPAPSHGPARARAWLAAMRACYCVRPCS